MFHQQHSASFQIGSNHSRQLNPQIPGLPGNRRIINYTSKIFPFPYLRERIWGEVSPRDFWIVSCQPLVAQTATTRLASYNVYFSRKPSQPAWRKTKEEEGWNTRRVPLPSWATSNPSFSSSSTSNFVSSIGPLIVFLLTKEHRNCDVILIYYESECRGWFFVSADDRGFSLLDSLSRLDHNTYWSVREIVWEAFVVY